MEPSRIPGTAGLRRVFGRLFGPATPPPARPELLEEPLEIMASTLDEQFRSDPSLGFAQVLPVIRSNTARRLAEARHRWEIGALNDHGQPQAGG